MFFGGLILADNGETKTSVDGTLKDYGRRLAELAVGYIAAITVLAYPIGVIVLGLQVYARYGFDLYKTLYTVGLVPTAVVTGKVLEFLKMAPLSFSAVVGVAVLIDMRSLDHDGVLQALPDEEVDGVVRFR